jgi:hypothetical protein
MRLLHSFLNVLVQIANKMELQKKIGGFPIVMIFDTYAVTLSFLTKLELLFHLVSITISAEKNVFK